MQQIKITADTLAKPQPRPSKDLLLEGFILPGIKAGTIINADKVDPEVQRGHIHVAFGRVDGIQQEFGGMTSAYLYVGHTDSTIGDRSYSSAPKDGTRAHIGNYKTSAKGIALLKVFEGCELSAYDDGVGVCTIGYGTTKGVSYGMHISQDKAEELLKNDLVEFEKSLQRLVTVPLNQNEFDALVVFIYNIGSGAFEDSTVRRLLNQGDYESPKTELMRWCKGGGNVLPGLERRRKAEIHLFYTGEIKTEFP